MGRIGSDWDLIHHPIHHRAGGMFENRNPTQPLWVGSDWVGLTRHMLLVVVNVTPIKFAIVTDTILLNILSVFIFFSFNCSIPQSIITSYIMLKRYKESLNTILNA